MTDRSDAPSPPPTLREGELTPEEEATFYVQSARWSLANGRRMIAKLIELEAVEALPEKEREKVARDRKQWEKLLPTLERNAQRVEAKYARIVGRPFSDDNEDDHDRC